MSMHSFQNNIRTLSQKNFRQGGQPQQQNGNIIDELRQREKVYLDVICDLTNRNRELEQQNRLYQQHCQMLEEELRRRDDVTLGGSRTRSSSSEKNLMRSFSGKLPEMEPQRKQIDVFQRKEIEQVDETPELTNNSSRFVERMALILDSNFGGGTKRDPQPLEEIPETGSTTQTDSLKSQENTTGGRTLESIRLIQGQTQNDFSSKNMQIRNVYTSAKEQPNQPTQSPFTKCTYRPLNFSTNFSATGQTSRKLMEGLDPPTVRQPNLHSFHRPPMAEGKQNIMQPRQNVHHSIFAQPSTGVKAILQPQPQMYRASNRSLTHKEYLKAPSEGIGLVPSSPFQSNGSQASLSYHSSNNSNSQLRIGSQY